MAKKSPRLAVSEWASGRDQPPTLATSREKFSFLWSPLSFSPLVCQNLEFCVKLLDKLLDKIKYQKGLISYSLLRNFCCLPSFIN